ncbi:MAG: hypothetical protein A2Y79_04940 [Deltaproteobacteria bacterium RBG_13_43_22]|jgi:hypothetical protein|nr:MAG: hypothetical protein A2Y79_04940 [Deltaproteobacteria bacterium RBG_13_43_22]
MRSLFLFFLFFFLIAFGTASKEIPKRSNPSGVNVMVHDVPCEEVKDRLLRECKNQQLPFVWADKDRGLLSIGPLNTTPLPLDPFIKMEEKSQLEIRCLDPLTTRISLQIQLRGLMSDNQWLEVKDPETLNAYGKRFLDRLIIY